MILAALIAFYGAMALGVVIVIGHAIFTHGREADSTGTPARGSRALVSGFLIALGHLAVWGIAKSFGPVHILFAPFVLGALGLWLVGYVAPKVLRSWVETKIREYIDYLYFIAPAALLSTLRGVRVVISWLGLAVK
jgi:hypothetical protein